jgi:NTE family protein
VKPAGFIRASMAIPVFFESYYVNNIPCKSDTIKKFWLDRFNEDDPAGTVRFVDGGILSNFPVVASSNSKITGIFAIR